MPISPAARCSAVKGLFCARTSITRCHPWKLLSSNGHPGGTVRPRDMTHPGARSRCPAPAWFGSGGVSGDHSVPLARPLLPPKPRRCPVPRTRPRCCGPPLPAPEGGPKQRAREGWRGGGREEEEERGMEKRRDGGGREAGTLSVVASQIPLALFPGARPSPQAGDPDPSLSPQVRAEGPCFPSWRSEKNAEGSPWLSRQHQPQAALRPPLAGGCVCRRGSLCVPCGGPRSLLGLIKSNRRASPRSRSPPAPPASTGPRDSVPAAARVAP